jgi:hypothetical protein
VEEKIKNKRRIEKNTKQLKLTSNQNKLKVLRSMGSLIMRLDRLNNKINEL